MDRPNRQPHFLLHPKIQDFLSRLQARSQRAKADPETLRNIRGLGLLFSSIALAWASTQLTQIKAVQAYRDSHWPSLRTWQTILESNGLHHRPDVGHFAKLLETHPEPFGDHPWIWTANDGCILYLTSSPFQSGPELWTCDGVTKAQDWIKRGSGLTGFEKLPMSLALKTQKTALVAKTKVKFVDPKEFHY